MSFNIAPLVWNLDASDEEGWQCWAASTPFGSYTVSKDYFHAGCRWRYCFAEYHDEGDADCDSIEDGKRLATENWLERLSGCLTPVADIKV